MTGEDESRDGRWATPPVEVARTDWRWLARGLGIAHMVLFGVAVVIAFVTIPLGAEQGILTVNDVSVARSPSGLLVADLAVPWLVGYLVMLPLAVASIRAGWLAWHGRPLPALLVIGTWLAFGAIVALVGAEVPGHAMEAPRTTILEAHVVPALLLVFGTWPAARALVPARLRRR